MRHVRFEIANTLIENLGRLRCFRRKELKRKRGRISAHDVRDVHEFRSYLRSCGDFWSTGQTSRSGRRSTSTFNTVATCADVAAISWASLLTVAAVTSQQVLITHNNFSRAGNDRGCVQLLTVLSTPCSAPASRRSAKVVREKKKKKKWA